MKNIRIVVATGAVLFALQFALDRTDGSYDWMLTISWKGFWKTESNPYQPN